MHQELACHGEVAQHHHQPANHGHGRAALAQHAVDPRTTKQRREVHLTGMQTVLHQSVVVREPQRIDQEMTSKPHRPQQLKLKLKRSHISVKNKTFRPRGWRGEVTGSLGKHVCGGCWRRSQTQRLQGKRSLCAMAADDPANLQQHVLLDLVVFHPDFGVCRCRP